MQLSRTTPTPSPTRRARAIGIAICLCALTVGVIQLFAGAAAASGGSKRVVSEAANPALNKSVLVNRAGLTLYSLSVERHGRFICTGSCLAVWHPLVVPRGVKPTGPVRLGTVKRPEGRIQVTFKGRPLYHFSGDSKKGEANGEGFKDVGTWHAAAVGPIEASAPQPQPEPKPAQESPYPYPY